MSLSNSFLLLAIVVYVELCGLLRCVCTSVYFSIYSVAAAAVLLKISVRVVMAAYAVIQLVIEIFAQRLSESLFPLAAVRPIDQVTSLLFDCMSSLLYPPFGVRCYTERLRSIISFMTIFNFLFLRQQVDALRRIRVNKGQPQSNASCSGRTHLRLRKRQYSCLSGVCIGGVCSTQYSSCPPCDDRLLPTESPSDVTALFSTYGAGLQSLRLYPHPVCCFL